MSGKREIVVTLFFILFVCATTHQWQLSSNLSGYSFFNSFSFWDQSIDGVDPTGGYVYYANEEESWEWGFVNVTENNAAYIGCDYWSIATGTGRGSVRLTSLEAWNHGLFIADIQHMPQGCGTWPAYWFLGPNWPNGGEIDVIEGVNLAQVDQTTLHTGPGCTMDNYYDSNNFTGVLVSGDCNANVNENDGCGIQYVGNSSYGTGFNANSGGVYALQWTNESITAWFFPRESIPADINKLTPDPSTWGTPYAYFPLGENCDPSNFEELQIVINLTFCGQWAGNVFGTSNCGDYYGDDCNTFVQNNPEYFKEAYWTFNSIQIYQ